MSLERKIKRKPIGESNLVIVGLARDCEHQIEKEVKVINAAFKNFNTVSWVIIESDSDDKTVEKIELIAQDMDMVLISLGRLRDTYPKMTERIAKCRNEYLTIIKRDKYAGFDYVAVADLDGVNKDVNDRAVASCWETEIEWDACFANQSAPYYDIWALRHNLWSPNDCFKNYHFLMENKVEKSRARFAAIHSRMIKIDPEQAPIEVDSAFGGLGIYKKALLEGCEYAGVDKEGSEFCEHVHIHRMMKKNGARLFVIPQFINSAWNAHSKNLLRYDRILLRLWHKLRFSRTIEKIKAFYLK